MIEKPSLFLGVLPMRLLIVGALFILISCGTDLDLTRCQRLNGPIVDKLTAGITASGDVRLSGVHVIYNNDGRPWRFIGAKIHAPGMEDGQIAVWATGSLDLNQDSLIVAADGMAAEFSIWQRPEGEGRFAEIFDDEIETVKACTDR